MFLISKDMWLLASFIFSNTEKWTATKHFFLVSFKAWQRLSLQLLMINLNTIVENFFFQA